MSSMPPADPTPRLERWRWAGLLLVGVLVVHVVQAVRMFPSVRSLVDPEAPVIVVDHAIHLYHGALGSRFLREHGTSWGFDPFFMAGYPETPVWDSSSNLSILFQLLAGGHYSPLAYKVGLLACMVLALGALSAGAIAAGLGRWEAAVATLLGWLYFWAGFPMVLWRSGLFAFVLVSAGLVLLLGLALRFDARPAPGRWAALAATGGALFFAHVTAPILAFGAVVGFAATALRRHDRLWSAALALALALAVAANLFWLVPLWRFRGIRTPAFSFLSSDSAWLLREFYLVETVDGRVSLILLILGFAGLCSGGRPASGSARRPSPGRPSCCWSCSASAASGRSRGCWSRSATACRSICCWRPRLPRHSAGRPRGWRAWSGAAVAARPWPRSPGSRCSPHRRWPCPGPSWAPPAS